MRASARITLSYFRRFASVGFGARLMSPTIAETAPTATTLSRSPATPVTPIRRGAGETRAYTPSVTHDRSGELHDSPAPRP